MILGFVLAVVGAWLGFANPVVHVPGLVLLFPLGLALLGLGAATPGLAFRRGMLAGIVASSGCLYWIALPVWMYGGLPLALAAPLPVLLSAYLALFTGLYCAILRHARPRLGWLPLGLLAGSSWASLELARGHFLTGFPWLQLPSALSAWPVAIQPVAVLGSYTYAGLLAACAAWLAMSPWPARLSGPRRGPVAAPVLALAILAATGLWGALALRAAPSVTRAANISVIQGNVDQGAKWDQRFQLKTVEDYVDLSAREAAEHGPELIIWPETAMPFYLQDRTPERKLLEDFVSRSRIPVLTGAPGYVMLPGGGHNLLNSAFLMDGRTPERTYSKAHLVPFGEYVPLGDLLPLGKLVQAAGNFKAGQDPAPLDLGDLALGILICYETIFPELAQERVEAGANLLVNISNDAWFGRSSAPRQHLDMAVLRAVEQGRFMVRSTNTGISAVIDPKGRIFDATALYETARLNRKDVGLIQATTPFHDLFGVMNALPPALTALLLAWARRAGQAHPNKAHPSKAHQDKAQDQPCSNTLN